MSMGLARLVRAVHHQAAPRHERAADAALLGRWVEQGDQAAFEVLLRRHGPMVWQTCRRVLRHEQDAEDAFQAVFLILARKAASIRRAPCLTGWLYRVAHRAALAARARPRRTVPASDLDKVLLSREREPGEDWRDWLDEELRLLPDRYREPFVLCYLEGRTTDEAAAALGCPRGTVGTRLAWARQRLRDRLARRGVELPACLVPLGGAVPPSLFESSFQGVVAWAAHETVLPAAASLCEEVIKVMFLDRIKRALLWLAPLLVLAAGGGWWLEARARADKPAKPSKPSVKPIDKPGKPAGKPAKPPAGSKKQTTPADVSGLVKEVSPDEKALTVVVPPRVKGEEPKTVTLKLAASTKVRFFGVGPGQAKIGKGYHVSAWLADGSKETPAHIVLHGSKGKGGPPPAVTGEVTAVAEDGKSFTVTVSGKGKKKPDTEEKPRHQTIKLAPKTTQTFDNVGPGEAKLARGLHVAVWLARGSKESAADVHFGGSTRPPFKKGEAPPPAYAGQVAAVAADGKSFTVQVPPRVKGGEATRAVVKLGPASRQLFFGVGPGQAKVQVGQGATVWVDDRAKDTATWVLFYSKSAGKSNQQVVAGEVTAVAEDGKSFTVHVPPGKKSEPGKDVEVKIDGDTRIVFHNVGPGGARITRGYRAHASLEPDAKDVAVSVIFSAPEK